MKPNPYDQVPYEGTAHSSTLPGRLAMIAALNGFEAPDPAACKVLELGCAEGANIIAMAATYPDSSFVGIDLSRRQILTGRKRLQQVGLTNIELRQADIRELPLDLANFDYILCHGVFSWIPQELQARLMHICSSRLAAEGLALISYNTLPGWYAKLMSRDLMLYRTQGTSRPGAIARETRHTLQALSKILSHVKIPSAHTTIYNEATKSLASDADASLLHDHLEENNHPIYFHEFATLADKYDLQYVDDARGRDAKIEPMLREFLSHQEGKKYDRLEIEQYKDFLVNCQFRRSIVTHKNRNKTGAAHSQLFRKLHIASTLKAAGGGAFLGQDGTRINISNEPIARILESLAECQPDSRGVGDLLVEFAHNLPDTEKTNTVTALLQLCGQNYIESYGHPVRLAATSTPHPYVRQINRVEAANKQPLTNLKHQPVKLTAMEQRVVIAMDGTASRERLIEHLWHLLKNNEIQIETGNVNLEDPVTMTRLLEKILDATLTKLVKNYLLTPAPNI